MANTQVVPFAQAPVPAHILKFQEDHGSNIDPKLTTNQLTFRGKVWRTVIDGEETAIMNKDDEPVSTVHVIILNHNKARSRAYYDGPFVEGKATPPACSSADGITPDLSIKEPQAAKCDKCPHSVKGSKITDNGKETTACSVFKRIAVLPMTNNLAGVPLLLRMAQTSMWDKNNQENEAKGYYAWDQYLDMLRQRGARHTGEVATKVRFDSRMAYPKLLFAASRWLNDEELELVTPMFDGVETLNLLNAAEAASAARAVRKADDDDEPTPAPSLPKKAKAAPVIDVEEEAPAPAKAAKPAKAAPVEVEDDDEAPPPPVKKAAKPAKAAPVEEDDAPPPPVKPAKPAKPAKAAPVEEDEAPAPAKGKAKGNGLADLIEEFDD